MRRGKKHAMINLMFKERLHGFLLIMKLFSIEERIDQSNSR